MKKVFTLIVSVFLASLFIISGCKKENVENPVETYEESNLYIGLVGFNDALHFYDNSRKHFCPISSGYDLEGFIDKLGMANGTLLYYSVDSALNLLKHVQFPDDLESVSVITFTDGLDQGSGVMNSNYSSSSAYLNAMNNRLLNEKVNGKPIHAYSIGILGDDVTDKIQFANNLSKLATSYLNVTEVTKMDDVKKRFQRLAYDIRSNLQTDISLEITTPYNGTKVRFTFDNVKSAALSTSYLEGVYQDGKLTNIKYVGCSSNSGSSVSAVKNGIHSTLTFGALKGFFGPIKTEEIQQWEYSANISGWQINSEFEQKSDIKYAKTSVIMLVLDCSSSLKGNFQYMKQYVKEFLGILNGTFSGDVQISFVELAGTTVSNVGVSSVTLSSTLRNVNSKIKECGFVYGTKEYPTINGTKVQCGISSLTLTNTISNLFDGTTYYVRSYAINEDGVSYGEQTVVTTKSKSLPTVTTSSASNITAKEATLGGNVTSDGGATVTERGVCWSISINPTITSNRKVIGNGTGSFSSTIVGLKEGTTYYVRAYATNSKGTVYGEQVTFKTTSAVVATVTTSSASNITTIKATLGGNVTSDGGAAVTERGVCWSTSTSPTISSSKKAIGSGTGSFSSTITDLQEGTTYYVRAYATNSKGTVYGEQVTFKTNIASLPTVTTSAVSNVTAAGASLGGNVTDDGGATVTERGVCWGTSTSPTISGLKKVIGTGTGSFRSAITDLKEGTTYYVRAYATNSKGTVYGEPVTFKTKFIKENGAIPVAFSVSSTKKVYFSQGNLQYQASTKTWRFAEHQYDMIGKANKNISSTYSGWIDLFGWGTSGYNSKYPYMTSTDYSDYGVVGDEYADIAGTNFDWGVYNKISNGGDVAGQWRTLTKDEWEYVLNKRADASSLKGLATVNGVTGLILLPDNWTTPGGITFKSGMNGSDSNTYSTSEWSKMEANGAVFLPAAGYRDGSVVSGVGFYWYYWSSTAYDRYYAYCLHNDAKMSYYVRSHGQSVRLVRDL